MSPEQSPLAEAQAAIKDFLLKMQTEARSGSSGERPDEQGAHTAPRALTKDVIDLTGDAMRMRLLKATARELAEEFNEPDAVSAVNAFLAALGDDMKYLPATVFGPLRVFVQDKYRVDLPLLSEETRRFELHVITLLPASNFTEEDFREKLARGIVEYKEKNSGKISEEQERAIALSLTDPLKVSQMREAS